MKALSKIITPFEKIFSDHDLRIPIIIITLTFLAWVSLPSSYVSVSFSRHVTLKLPFSNSSELLKSDAASQLMKSRIAVCLVGGPRRFELTGPSIVDRLLRVYPNSDLFLITHLDSDSYKLFLLKDAPRIAAFRIFNQKPLLVTESASRVLTSSYSPNGVQGLLQYFSLIEDCLTLVKLHQQKNNFTYDWIIRTRLDGYWSEPLGIDSFNPGKYTVPEGSSYGGLNDRFGVGDYNTSSIALSRLSLIPRLDSAGLVGLNSEGAFKAQFTIHNVEYTTVGVPFCIVTDRVFGFPPWKYYVPVLAMSSHGALNGSYCRPCTAICIGSCVKSMMTNVMYNWWRAMGWDSDRIELCDADGELEKGWEEVFDEIAGKKYAEIRKGIKDLNMSNCIHEFDRLKSRTDHWDAPTPLEICKIALQH